MGLITSTGKNAETFKTFLASVAHLDKQNKSLLEWKTGAANISTG